MKWDTLTLALQHFNPFIYGDAYMSVNLSSLVQKPVYRRRQFIFLTNARKLLIGLIEQTSAKSYSKFIYFIQEKAIEFVVWKMAAILARPQYVNG